MIENNIAPILAYFINVLLNMYEEKDTLERR